MAAAAAAAVFTAYPAAAVFTAYPAAAVYRAGRPVSAATFSATRGGVCSAGQKGRVFAPVLSCWCGLRRLQLPAVGIRSAPPEKKDKCRRMVVYASLFGVGAPEALVIGVVALLVFGPKGLAEVARTLGKTLRAFQPTIRELQEVSRDFKQTLEREIGLDEDITSTRTANRSSIEKTQDDVNLNGSPSFEEILRASREQLRPSPASTASETVEDTETKSYTSEELLKLTEEQLAASLTKQQSANDAKQKEAQSAAPEIAVGTPVGTTPAPASQKPEIRSENET